MSKIGKLIHIDCHQLSKWITIGDTEKTYYLLGVIENLNRIFWIELIKYKKGLTVMVAVLKALNMLNSVYGIKTEQSNDR